MLRIKMGKKKKEKKAERIQKKKKKKPVMEKISKIFLYFEHEKQARRRSMSEAGRGATESERPRDEGKGQLRSLELSAS